MSSKKVNWLNISLNVDKTREARFHSVRIFNYDYRIGELNDDFRSDRLQ